MSKDKIGIMEVKLNDLKEQNSQEHRDIKAMISEIKTDLKNALNNKANKDEFVFWRNILISGILISIFLGVLSLYIEKLIK